MVFSAAFVLFLTVFFILRDEAVPRGTTTLVHELLIMVPWLRTFTFMYRLKR